MMSKLCLSPLLLTISSMSLSLISSFFTPVVPIPVPNADISIAGAGGDFSTRTASFIVPDVTTITPVKYGLRKNYTRTKRTLIICLVCCQLLK